MTTTTEFEDAMNQLAGMRREIIALLLPLHTQLGFNVIENRLVPGATIMLSPSDYAIFKELVAALPAHPNASATTDAPGQSPPAAGGVGPTEKTVCSADGCSRTEDCGPFCRNRN